MNLAKLRILITVTIAMSLLTIAACSPTSILNFTSGAGSMRTAQDLPYGPHPRQKLDVYAGEEPVCRILFIYGGNWREGDKSMYGFVGAQLAKLGFEVVIPNYRLYPEVVFPAFVDDVALSLDSDAVLGSSDSLPLVLVGHSAGGLIAALLALEPAYLARVGRDPAAIKALITLAGPHDYFLPTDNPRWTPIFGDDPQTQVNALPVRHVSAQAPPTLLLHGDEDTIVTPKSAHSMAERLTGHNVFNRLRVYAGVDHKKIIAAVAFPLHFLAPTLEDIAHFMSDIGCGHDL